jgi:hypothetical protein
MDGLQFKETNPIDMKISFALQPTLEIQDALHQTDFPKMHAAAPQLAKYFKDTSAPPHSLNNPEHHATK